jgi:hypothetical protein
LMSVSAWFALRGEANLLNQGGDPQHVVDHNRQL